MSSTPVPAPPTVVGVRVRVHSQVQTDMPAVANPVPRLTDLTRTKLSRTQWDTRLDGEAASFALLATCEGCFAFPAGESRLRK
jgi:hypothetical protein